MEINGKKVVDATRKAKIVVTKRDTQEGDNKNPSSCAAARAAKRDIIAFDKGGSFQPGEYELRPMSPSNRKATGSETSRTKKRTSAEKSPRKHIHVALIKHHKVTGIRPRGATR